MTVTLYSSALKSGPVEESDIYWEGNNSKLGKRGREVVYVSKKGHGEGWLRKTMVNEDRSLERVYFNSSACSGGWRVVFKAFYGCTVALNECRWKLFSGAQ